MQNEYTPEHREATEAILTGFIGQIIQGVASARGLEEGYVRQALDAAPLTCSEAVSRKLVDGSIYRFMFNLHIRFLCQPFAQPNL